MSRGSFRYCQRAAHVPIGRPGEVQGNMGGVRLQLNGLAVGGSAPGGWPRPLAASKGTTLHSGGPFLPGGRPHPAPPSHPRQRRVRRIPHKRGTSQGVTTQGRHKNVHSECTLIFRAPPAPQTRSILRPPTPANKHCPQRHHAEVVRPPTCVRQPSPSNSRCHARQSPRLAKRIVKFG